MPSEQSAYCLLVSRAGKTDIFPLTEERAEIPFGYAPPDPERDLVLYDGLLEDNQGAILYKKAEPNQNTQNSDKTNFYIKAYADSIRLREMPIPPRDGVEIPLSVNDEIKVGRKYVLTFSLYQPPSERDSTQLIHGLSQPLKAETSPSAHLIQELLGETSQIFMSHMPEIYHPSSAGLSAEENFLSRFLALFESVMIPWNWCIDNFDLYLHPQSAPPEFLPWLARWYGVTFWDETLTPEQQRILLIRLHDLVRQRGTVAGLCDLLSCYVSGTIKINDQIGENQFRVQFSSVNNNSVNNSFFTDAKKKKIQALIDWYKPVHTTYTIEFPVERST